MSRQYGPAHIFASISAPTFRAARSSGLRRTDISRFAGSPEIPVRGSSSADLVNSDCAYWSAEPTLTKTHVTIFVGAKSDFAKPYADVPAKKWAFQKPLRN